ncbi:hypothetical protein [Chitinophaga lutea]|nr:hypothetical protein [Chitinophaga lutea]
MKHMFARFASLLIIMMMMQVTLVRAQSAENKVKQLTYEILTSVSQQEEVPNDQIQQDIAAQNPEAREETLNVREIIVSNLKAAACPDGFYCLHGFCISYWQGAECRENSDCPWDQICYNNRCSVFGGGPCE